MINTSVTLEIMDRKFKVSCSPSEKTTIIDASEMINAQIREIKKHGKSIGSDRVAIMAALNIANEYLLKKNGLENFEQNHESKICELLEKIESSLKDLK